MCVCVCVCVCVFVCVCACVYVCVSVYKRERERREGDTTKDLNPLLLRFNFALQVPFSGINVPFFGLKAQFSVDNVPFLGIHVLHLGLQYALFGFELLDADIS